jgi:hypothetical protein
MHLTLALLTVGAWTTTFYVLSERQGNLREDEHRRVEDLAGISDGKFCWMSCVSA